MDSSEFYVENTNLDASRCKKSAINKNYWSDDFLGYFYKKSLKNQHVSCEIHRGYTVRAVELFDIVKNFIDQQGNQACNIVNYGCGFETMYFRLCQIDRFKNGLFKFFEIDLPSIVKYKTGVINTTTNLKNHLFGQISYTTNKPIFLDSEKYCCFTCDLANIEDMKERLIQVNFDQRLPTLFLAECVLVYLQPNQIANLISFSFNLVNRALFVEYDPLLLNDTFSRIMLNNLSLANILFHGKDCCSSEQNHIDKFKPEQNGHKIETIFQTISQLYKNVKYKKMKTIEPLDETVLLDDLLNHYCICVAFKNYDIDFVKTNIWI